jgi:hypothetical protein
VVFNMYVQSHRTLCLCTCRCMLFGTTYIHICTKCSTLYSYSSQFLYWILTFKDFVFYCRQKKTQNVQLSSITPAKLSFFCQHMHTNSSLLLNSYHTVCTRDEHTSYTFWTQMEKFNMTFIYIFLYLVASSAFFLFRPTNETRSHLSVRVPI